MTRFTPTEDQELAIRRMLSEPTRAALNVSDTGGGKTLQAAELALRLGAKIVLVIAPIGTHKGWKATFERQGWKHPIQHITSKHPENHARLIAGESGLYLVGREFFYLSANASKPDENGEVKRDARWSWAKAKADLVVIDESHSAKNRYGLMYETLKTLPKTAYRLAMSATPQGSHFDGIWAPTRWLWPQYPGPVDRSKQRWVAQWCETEKVWTGNGEYATKIIGERKPGAFLKTLPCVVKVTVDKKPYQLFDVKLTLSPEHKAVWDEMAETSIAWLNDNPTVAKMPMERRLRLRQMALAMPTIDENGEVDFEPDAESPKLRAALKIQERHPGEAILYVTDSAKFARIAAPRIGAKLLVGGMKKADRDWLVSNLGESYHYLIATYGAVAEGTDGLQERCSVEVLFNPADGSVPNEQFAGRLNRMGQTAEFITRYRLIARDTLDDEHYVVSVLNQKLRRSEVDVGSW